MIGVRLLRKSLVLSLINSGYLETSSKSPETSVIISTYNYASFIQRALDSVFNQTYTNYEVIVIDDGSTDNTVQILQPYMDSGKLHYIYQQNKGPERARNTGIKVARGSWIAFLDADDIWQPQKLQVFHDFIKKNPELVWVYSNMEVLNPDGSLRFRWFERKKLIGEGYIFNQLILECFIITSAVMVRQSALAEMGCFREDLDFGSDYRLWLDIAKKYPIGKIDQSLTFYQRHGENFSSNNRNKFEGSFIFYKDLYQSEGRQLALKDRLHLKRNLAEACFDLGYFEYKQGNRFQSRSPFLECLKYNPIRYHALLYWLASFFKLK